MSIQHLTIWPITRLSDVLSVLESGSRPPGGVSNVKEGVPSIGGEHLGENGRFNFKNLKYIPKTFFQNLTRGIIQKQDILIVKDGATTGKTSFVSEEFPFEPAAVNEHVYILRPQIDLLLPEYLFFFLLSEWGQVQIQRSFQGAAIGGINRSFAELVEIPLPPLSEQQEIVRMLRQADELRELRAQANSRIQDLLPALFDEMFGYPGQSSFPIKTLDKIIKKKRPITYGILKPGPDVEDGVPYVRILNIKGGRLYVDQLHRTSAEIAAQYKRSQLEPGDILVTIRGTVGRTCIVPQELRGANITQDTARLSIIDSVENLYVMAFLNSRWTQKWMETQTIGQAVQGLNLRELRKLPIPLAPRDQQLEFALRARLVTEIDEQQNIASEKIKSTFNSIIAKAFTGELTAGFRERQSKILEQEEIARDETLSIIRQRRFRLDLTDEETHIQFMRQVARLIQPAIVELLDTLDAEDNLITTQLPEFRLLVEEIQSALPIYGNQVAEILKTLIANLQHGLRQRLFSRFEALTGSILPFFRDRQSEAEVLTYLAVMTAEVQKNLSTNAPQAERLIRQPSNGDGTDVIDLQLKQLLEAAESRPPYFRPVDLVHNHIGPAEARAGLEVLCALGFVRPVQLAREQDLIYRLIDPNDPDELAPVLTEDSE